MTLYEIKAWKKEEECNFSPFTSYRDAVYCGNEYYPSGYDIIEIDTEE